MLELITEFLEQRKQENELYLKRLNELKSQINNKNNETNTNRRILRNK